MPALGERFRAAREARGLSLSDVSEQIRIRSVYLAAIEEENWAAIGAPVYTRGFLRTYARFLGLDPEEVVAVFNGAPQPSIHAKPAGLMESPRVPVAAPGTGPQAGSQERRSGGGSWMLWVAGVVAVLMVAYVVYNVITFPRPAGAPTQAAVTVEPSETPSGLPSNAPGAVTASPPAAAAGPDTLALVLSAPSWLRVTVDGNVSMEGTFPAGTSKTFHGKNALIRIGNAGGVEIYVDGKDVGKLGKSGDVAERTFSL